MTFDELLDQLKTELPKHQWLIRSGGDSRGSMFPGIAAEPGEFFAHIFRGTLGPAGYSEDYWAYDADPVKAMERAIADAKAKRNRSVVAPLGAERGMTMKYADLRDGMKIRAVSDMDACWNAGDVFVVKTDIGAGHAPMLYIECHDECHDESVHHGLEYLEEADGTIPEFEFVAA